MYPRSIIERGLYPQHLGKEWLEGYKQIHDKRVEAKALGKEDKKYQSISEAFKLSLNGGGFGKTNEPTSWQYDPLLSFKVTINNQFALLMLCEKMLLNNIFVVSLNTDGILCIVKQDQVDLYKKLCSDWEKLTRHTLEQTYYKKFIQTSVNDYIAQKTDGEIKYKGDFEIDKELHKNKSNTIRAKALKEHYINNIKPIDTIKQSDNIYDFCIGRKKKSNQIYTYQYAEEFTLKNETFHDKVIRYYISTNGGKMSKIQDNSKITKLEQKYRITPYMNHNKQDISLYNIDYSYYESETIKVINSIKKFNLEEYLKSFKNYKQLKLF